MLGYLLRRQVASLITVLIPLYLEIISWKDTMVTSFLKPSVGVSWMEFSMYTMVFTLSLPAARMFLNLYKGS